MYLDYFSLKRHPFRITPDTSLFFSGGNQGRGVVLDAILYAIETGEGILKVVGEVGSGKTMLCRMLEKRLPETTEVVYLANPKLDPEEILYAVAFELKLPVRRETSRLLVMQQLQNYLLKQHAANRKVLVTIEEAQSMPFETLEEIRLLSNLETHRDKLMQIILFGQPELDKTLSEKKIRQLRERITHSFYLHPLSKAEVAEYIRFRLSAAGCPSPQLMSKSAERLIAKASQGLTRRINILSDKALLAAYSNNVLRRGKEITSKSRPLIKRKHVKAAIGDSDYSMPLLQAIFSPLRLVSVSLFAATVAVTISLWPGAESIASQAKISQQLIQSLLFDYEDSVVVIDKPESKPMARPATIEPLKPSVFPESETPASELSGQLLDSDEESEQLTQIEETELLPVTQQKNLIKTRILASLKWLEDADKSGYTVQFISDDMSNLDFAETFLGILDREGLITESYMCISTANNSSYWTVKYGNFSGLSAAQEFVDDLPSVMHEFSPFVQNMEVVECNTNTTIAALILE